MTGPQGHPDSGPSHDPDLALPPATPVSRDSTAGVAVMAHLRRQTAALLDAHRQIGAGDDPIAAVHASRVAARRLRSGLRVYGDLLREDVSAQLRPELSWYAGALSPVRDLDVFAASLSAPADDDARRLADALGPWLRRERDAAFAAAVEQLATARASVLRARLVSVAREPSFTKVAGRRATAVLAPRVLHADHRSFRMLANLSAGDPGELWHAARITAKRARYAAEVGAPALGHACRDLAYVWADITDPLGEAQDAVIQRALVLDRVSDPSLPLTAAEAFACGVFVESTREREIAEHLRAHRVWDDVRGRHKRLRRALAR